MPIPKDKNRAFFLNTIPGFTGFLIGVISLFVVFISLPFFTAPAGTEGRPMGFALAWFVLGGTGILAGITGGVASWVRGARLTGIALAILGLIPTAIGWFAMYFAVEFRNYQFLP